MEIALQPVDAVPPITAPQGLLYDVYFEVGSFDLDKVVSAAGDTKHQGVVRAGVWWLELGPPLGAAERAPPEQANA